MQLGAVFPHEIGASPAAVREFAETVESLGYAHLTVSDHVVLAAPGSQSGAQGPYTSGVPFHEAFVLFGYLAAVTQRIELVTSILILPQRQTALVAKQAAEVDVLSGGRLRLGVGVGWNEVEYQGLNQDFHNRGARSEEQIALLRALWSEPAITFDGRWHHIEAAGINPLPVRRSIPIWLGGHSDAALERAARLGDGWLSLLPPNDETRERVKHLRDYVREAGRDQSSVAIEARLSLSQVKDEAGWKQYMSAWQALGATHLSIGTAGAGFTSLDAHLGALRRVKEVLGG